MNKLITQCVFVIFSIVGIAFAQTSPSTKTITLEKQQSITPQQALQRLKEGNQRFVDGKMKNRDLLSQVGTTASGQFPLAVVLNCMDSRTPPELVFDQGVGDMLAIRIGGNIQNNDILGSLEFGTKLMGARVIAVIGHTRCGAIRGACEKAKLGQLTQLLNKIQPAVTETTKSMGHQDCANYEFIDQIAKNNVNLVIKQIKENSPVIRNLIAEGQVEIVGGMQDISTGQVTFFK